MLIDDLKKQYTEQGEAILLEDLLKDYGIGVEQEVKALVESKQLEQFEEGVYFLSYTTILGTEGTMSIRDYVYKKFVRGGNGYETGVEILNRFRFTTQNSAVYEICTNKTTEERQELSLDGYRVFLYNPKTHITEKNAVTLQFLDLMNSLLRISEITGEELRDSVKKYVEINDVDFSLVKQYVDLYPDTIYKAFYKGGIINEML